MNTVAPSGVVTFLFTDIEGSTRRWEADADAMRAALTAHDDLLRETVSAHDGWLFKHTGDGICAAFASPRAAVDAAVAAQRALELPVRMAIATGEADLRDEDYFGAVLNRAARMMAAGHGGQVLLDGATAELLTGVELRELGPPGECVISPSRSMYFKSSCPIYALIFLRCGRSTRRRGIYARRRQASSGGSPRLPTCTPRSKRTGWSR